MQAFLRFRALLACGFALASALLFAAPASAASGSPVVGCITGSSCMVEINYYVTYSGSSGGGNGVVVKPPPCIAVPVGDAHTGSQIITAATVYAVATPDGKNNGKYILGSRDVTSAARFGVGQPIDCGVTYTAPGPYQLKVSVGWSACWAPGTVASGGPPANCNPNFPGGPPGQHHRPGHGQRPRDPVRQRVT